jgi:hypothetical protein
MLKAHWGEAVDLQSNFLGKIKEFLAFQPTKNLCHCKQNRYIALLLTCTSRGCSWL